METEESASGHETIEATGPGVTLTWQEILDCDGSECEAGPAPDEILVAARVPEILVEAAPDGGNWLIDVRDNGIGFEDEYSGRIFLIF
ncbi:MAG: hypothetical protein HQL40_11365, partial [Alphaproteobacteria bacterium]|nr:hypothetical protein [Alphaproteobacteria bacterium]